MSDFDPQEHHRELILGFLALRETKAGIRYGLLITDASGVPKEFRATEPPVRPTKVQRILYGASLCREIARIAGGPIIRAVEHAPTWIFAERAELLSLGTPAVPVIWIKAYGEELEARPTSEEAGEMSNQHVLRVNGGAYRFVTVRFDPSMPEDEQQRLREQIENVVVSGALDPLEPFDRIQRALDVLDQQAAKGGDR